MKLYLAICNDRHIDTVVKVFSSKNKAISYARAFVKFAIKTRPDSKRDLEYRKIEGWLYYCRYSCEGDSVHVETAWLNDNETR